MYTSNNGSDLSGNSAKIWHPKIRPSITLCPRCSSMFDKPMHITSTRLSVLVKPSWVTNVYT